MSKILHFYGTSDDLLECEGDLREESCNSGKGDLWIAVKSAEGTLRVVGTYMDGGCWGIGIAQTEEGAQLPLWPISYTLQEKSGYPDPQSYSARLTLTVPDDATVISCNSPDADQEE